MKKGIILINVLIFAAITVTVTISLVNWGALVYKSVVTLESREQALQMAEAGIEYYRWHLAHAPTDYRDGTTTPGPYVHAVQDSIGNTIGSYSLSITPPVAGSTIVTIDSTGSVLDAPGVTRKVRVTLAKASFAKHAFLANDFMRFGSGTVVNGPIHSNKGIHFDGVAYNIVASAMATTTDPDNSRNCTPYPACGKEWGVYTLVGTDDPQPPTALPDRSDVFVAGRSMPVQNVSFAGMTADFNLLQQVAINADPITNKYNISASGTGYHGYRIKFSYSLGTTTYNLYKVDTLAATPNSCSGTQTNWGIWSINTAAGSEDIVSSNNHLPSTGVIFVADNVWVDGTIGNGARITIAAAKLPQPAVPPDIILNKDLRYTNYDGSEVIGLISQGNVTVGLYSEDDLMIDAALVAQNGRVGRFSYGGSCESSTNGNEWRRGTITIHGMIATFIRYGFSYTGGTYDCGGSVGFIGNGYCNRNITYDSNLLYGPPPSFPLSSDQYTILSWREVN